MDSTSRRLFSPVASFEFQRNAKSGNCIVMELVIIVGKEGKIDFFYRYSREVEIIGRGADKVGKPLTDRGWPSLTV